MAGSRRPPKQTSAPALRGYGCYFHCGATKSDSQLMLNMTRSVAIAPFVTSAIRTAWGWRIWLRQPLRDLTVPIVENERRRPACDLLRRLTYEADKRTARLASSAPRTTSTRAGSQLR